MTMIRWAMATITADEVFTQLMSLEEDDREAVMLRAREASQADDGWQAEDRETLFALIDDRLARYDRGQAGARPADESVSRLRARLAERSAKGSREARSGS